MEPSLPSLTEVDSPSASVSLDFPLSSASFPTARQSVTSLAFNYHAFLGSLYEDQRVVSNSSVFITYRDESGNYLDSDYVSQDLIAYFKDFTFYDFQSNITSCAYFDDEKWVNDTCQTVFLPAVNQVMCKCPHMSFYAVIEDYGSRMPALPSVLLAIRDWPAFGAFMYALIIAIFGFVYTSMKDSEDLRALRG